MEKNLQKGAAVILMDGSEQALAWDLFQLAFCAVPKTMVFQVFKVLTVIVVVSNNDCLWAKKSLKMF